MCVDHIWHRSGAGSEHWSNYATICDAIHPWKTDWPLPGQVAITLAKFKLAIATGDRRHFDLEALARAMGKPDLAGWLSVQMTTKLHPSFLPIASRLLAELHDHRNAWLLNPNR